MFLGSKVRRVRRADNLTTPSVSRLSRQCGFLNISQFYRPPRPVMGIALLCIYSDITEVWQGDILLTKAIYYNPRMHSHTQHTLTSYKLIKFKWQKNISQLSRLGLIHSACNNLFSGNEQFSHTHLTLIQTLQYTHTIITLPTMEWSTGGLHYFRLHYPFFFTYRKPNFKEVYLKVPHTPNDHNCVLKMSQKCL
jgi:hypothetical protein